MLVQFRSHVDFIHVDTSSIKAYWLFASQFFSYKCLDVTDKCFLAACCSSFRRWGVKHLLIRVQPSYVRGEHTWPFKPVIEYA